MLFKQMEGTRCSLPSMLAIRLLDYRTIALSNYRITSNTSGKILAASSTCSVEQENANRM